MRMKKSVREAIRVIGHLLETNSARSVIAEDSDSCVVGHNHPDACRWCLLGATYVVCSRVVPDADSDEIESEIRGLLKSDQMWFTDIWDVATDEQQRTYIEKMKAV